MSAKSVRKRPVDLTDTHNPEWTKEDFDRSRPGAEALPAEVLAAFAKPRGRPKAEAPKLPVKLRIDADVVEAYKATGPGWQTRMNGALRKAVEDLQSGAAG